MANGSSSCGNASTDRFLGDICRSAEAVAVTVAVEDAAGAEDGAGEAACLGEDAEEEPELWAPPAAGRSAPDEGRSRTRAHSRSQRSWKKGSSESQVRQAWLGQSFRLTSFILTSLSVVVSWRTREKSLPSL